MLLNMMHGLYDITSFYSGKKVTYLLVTSSCCSAYTLKVLNSLASCDTPPNPPSNTLVTVALHTLEMENNVPLSNLQSWMLLLWLDCWTLCINTLTIAVFYNEMTCCLVESNLLYLYSVWLCHHFPEDHYYHPFATSIALG
jgi:hypothetical protein